MTIKMELLEKVWKFATGSPDYNLIFSHLPPCVFFPNEGKWERQFMSENFQVTLHTAVLACAGGERLKATALRDPELCSCVKFSNYLFEPNLEGSLKLPTHFFRKQSGIWS